MSMSVVNLCSGKRMKRPHFYTRLESRALISSALVPYPRRTDLDDALAMKADAEVMYNAKQAVASSHQAVAAARAALSQKADRAGVYSKTEADTMIATVTARFRTSDTQDLVDASFAKTSDAVAALSLKADRRDVYSRLETATRVEAALQPYRKAAAQNVEDDALARTADVHAALTLKADKVDVYSRVETAGQLAFALAPYRTSAAQDAIDCAFVSSAELLATLARKADLADVYSKAAADALVAPKASAAELSALDGGVRAALDQKLGVVVFDAYVRSVGDRFANVEQASYGPVAAAQAPGFEQILDGNVVRSLGVHGSSLSLEPVNAGQSLLLRCSAPTQDWVDSRLAALTFSQGVTGARGPTGERGAKGSLGAPGLLGLPGLTGDAGATGPAGAAGATGCTGPVGSPGPVGATGAAGASVRPSSKPMLSGLSILDLPEFEDDESAYAGGLSRWSVYRSGAQLMIVSSLL